MDGHLSSPLLSSPLMNPPSLARPGRIIRDGIYATRREGPVCMAVRLVGMFISSIFHIIEYSGANNTIAACRIPYHHLEDGGLWGR